MRQHLGDCLPAQQGPKQENTANEREDLSLFVQAKDALLPDTVSSIGFSTWTF
eukprot:CAMPEP_0177600530 /NCGR_PEP_ID=MMETSP0419_2-20121207/13690_1 /TAXON_ID=582737 /ORGANISM="Tetraselmis sp., Strain GSL018" /LENGTH=52 /DNA_ID=CAMNT_0019093565 /DNA_START=114 /DNA_END=269 /DNA_ORIENTATION=-